MEAAYMKSKEKTIKQWFGNNIWSWSLIGIFMIWTVMCLMKKTINFEYLASNIYLSCFLIMMVFSQTVVTTTGEGAIDLSIFNVVSLSPYLMQFLTEKCGNFIFGLILTLLVCTIIGFFNATINYCLKVPAMIATLATGYMVYSLTIVLSTQTAGVPHEIFKTLAVSGKIGGIHLRIIFTLALALIMSFLLYRTNFGWSLHAIGQNRTAAKYSGIKVFRTVLIAFGLSSVIAGISGLVLNGYLGLAGQDTGDTYMLPCLAATVIGGTNIDGGKSSILGGVIAGIMWTMFNALLNISGLDTSFTSLLQGIALLIVLVAAMPKKQVNR